jgi:GH25 family lysozyme M1 (1,4-beta-N-acetylmuramidase)
MLKGIDVSVWQRSIDWSKTKSEIDFAILRAGYGKLVSQKDDRFEEYYAACEKYGIPKGAYWFSYATTKAEAIQEAKACIECLKGKKFEYPILFDIEHKTQTSKSVADVIIPAFCDTLRDAGYYPGVYTYYSFIKSYISESVYSKYDLAIAHYASSTPWTQKTIWQYSSTGTVSGISGSVDLDYCYVDDYPAKIKKLGLNNLGSSTTSSTVTESTTSTTSYVVSTSKSAPENKVTTYASTDKTQISKHFNVQEFKCKCGSDHSILVNHYLVYQLEKIMDTLNCSMAIINSGYRCPTYDKTIGGFVGQHGVGNAVDIVFYDKNKKVISSKIISCVAQDLGLGGIANITSSYTSTHLDARTSNIWKGDECVNNNTVTSDFYKYYGLSKSDVYGTSSSSTTTTSSSNTTTSTTTTSSTSSIAIKAGTKVTLSGDTLYSTSTVKVGNKKSGTYYVYSTEVVNNRIRVTNSASNVGKTPVGTYVSGWVDVSVVSGTTTTSTSSSLKAGTKVVLKSTALYSTATATKYSSKKSGTYYIYSSDVSNGRIRITNSSSNVGKTPAGTYVSGWVNTSDIG